MSEYLATVGLPYTMSTEKAYSTDANVLGATHEAKDLEHLDKGMMIVEPIMGVAHYRSDVRIASEKIDVTFEQRRPGGARRAALRVTGRAVSRSEPHRRPPRARA